MAWERNGINGQPARPERGTAGARHAGGEVQDPERVPHDGNARADDSWLSDSDRRAGAGLRHAPGSAGAGRQTVVLKNCNLDSVVLAKLNVEADNLDEEVSFTFDGAEILDSFS